MWSERRIIGYLCLCLAANISTAQPVPQWDYSRVDRLSLEAQVLIEREQPTAGYALYEEILYLIRIEKGLYSTDQVPYLLEHMEWSKRIGDWDKVIDTGNRIRWILERNENQLNNYRRLMLSHIHTPEDAICMERHDNGRFVKSEGRCEAFRYFVADTFIAATEIQQKVANQTIHEQDWAALGNLAQITAQMVHCVDGPPILLVEVRDNEFYRTENPEIRQRYRPATWLRIAKTAEGKKKERNP